MKEEICEQIVRSLTVIALEVSYLRSTTLTASGAGVPEAGPRVDERRERYRSAGHREAAREVRCEDPVPLSLSLSISVYDIHILSVHICFFSVFLSLVSEWWHRTEQPWSIVFHILENTALRPNTIDVGQRIVKLLAANEAVLSLSLSLNMCHCT